MRRYQNRNRDLMGYAGEPAPSFKPPQMPSQLDPKDERLLELSAEVGNLQGQNDMLAEDNGRLEDENRQLRERNKELQERNTQLESQASADRAGYKSGFELVQEIEEAVKKMKASK